MLRHVVMFSWAEGVDQGAAAAELTAALATMPAAIPEIVAYAFGPDAGINEGNFDYAVVADFASPEDYVTYRDHPDHRQLIERHIAGKVQSRAAVQYETG